ncbi:FixH family protein [Leptospira adleri]|uniref:Nitrogen fixation protein FixH n=1 Tax=Leptospira adleri TaxID=2023186 RepID=A0A2M9YM04_9LEPT|nr:FixH family protein [Leptospira adleri]PJZ52564.1 nitrogen fixation protein FixH [Leptospira adleri]PJZ60959.1 nitrogen fixation protein FixH [Leptospira adleri]
MALHKSMKLAFVWIGVAFAALIAATVVTIRYASEGYTGPIEKGYYEKGLNYEKSILEQRKMIAEGYSYESELFSSPQNIKKGKNLFSIRFRKADRPVTGAKLNILLERGATDEWNRSIPLTEDPKNSGTYRGEVEIPESGLWILNLQGETEGRILQKSAEVNIQ